MLYLSLYLYAYKCLNANNCWHCNVYEQDKFRGQLSWAWKKFYNLRACRSGGPYNRCWFNVFSYSHYVWGLVLGPCFVMYLLMSKLFLNHIAKERKLDALTLIVTLLCCASSLQCCSLVCGLWLWHFLVILIVNSNVIEEKRHKICLLEQQKVDFNVDWRCQN